MWNLFLTHHCHCLTVYSRPLKKRIINQTRVAHVCWVYSEQPGYDLDGDVHGPRPPHHQPRQAGPHPLHQELCGHHHQCPAWNGLQGFRVSQIILVLLKHRSRISTSLMSTILVSLMSLSLDVDVPDVVVPDFVVPIVCVSDFNDSDVGPPDVIVLMKASLMLA